MNMYGDIKSKQNRLGKKPKEKALEKGKDMKFHIKNKVSGHPISSNSGGRHKFVDSKTKKEHTGGIYGGMSLDKAMEFEKRRKERDNQYDPARRIIEKVGK